MCDTNAKKAAFAGDAWRAYYGKRIWDGRTAAIMVGSIIPATSALAVKEFYSEVKAQAGAAMDLLEQAANDAVRALRADAVGGRSRAARLGPRAQRKGVRARARACARAHACARIRPGARAQGNDLKQMFANVVNAVMADPFSVPEYDKPTFGIKATVLRVNCNNKAAGIRLPSEGYLQFAFAYKIKG